VFPVSTPGADGIAAGDFVSQAVSFVGRTCHLAHTRKSPAPPGSAHAAYVLVPPGATAKTLITEFARYLGIPTTTRMTQTQITDAVCHTYTQAGVQLVLVDEIHRLNPRTTTGAQTADLLKDLTERLPATFVYAGINVTDTPSSPAPAAPNSPDAPPSSPAAPYPPATAPATPSATSSPTSKTPSTSTTNPAPSPATPPTSTSAPPAASNPSPASSAKPPSPPSTTTPNTSPKPPSTPYDSTTSPNNTTAPPATANRTPTGPGKTALTSKNTKRAITRQDYLQPTPPHSTHNT
jgi:hypothetical protein